MPELDAAKTPRDGEELDAGKVGAFLRDALPELSGDVKIAQFPGGASNLTYLVKVGNDEFILRRPPFGSNVKSAHDMGREYKVLSRLHAHFPEAPEPVAFCDDHDLMGCDFYIMRRIRGVILRRDLPTDWPLDADGNRQLCESLVDTQLRLHQVDFEAAGLGDLGKPKGYISRQVSGWNDRFRAARTDNVPDCEDLMDWLEQNQPADSGRAAIVHNDYKFDNVVLDPADPLKIIGVLDWEMTTLGDPLMDLGCSLSYWVQADDPQMLQMVRMMPTNADGMMTRDQIAARYIERSGLEVESFDFYFVFGLFRLAVIVQQIYARFAAGKTRDQRFANFYHFVRILHEQASAVIGRN